MKHQIGHSSVKADWEYIQSLTRELGFELCHAAQAGALEQERPRLESWLGHSMHASMQWMENNIDRRTNPAEIVPGAKSVIVLGFNYYSPQKHTSTDSSGKISRYAWGDDYHDVLKPKLKAIAQNLEERYPDHAFRFYNDTGPVMEKQWARKTQFGWQGKHSNVISRSHGSWLFIAAIITTLELPYEQPHEDFCGSCTACIDACPTNAIVEPYVVDSQKCLSYWTIEAKPHFEIPLEIQENMEGWVFGCDICQDVCPWNRFEQDADKKPFQPRHGETSLDTRWIEGLSQEEFSARFKKSPIKRTKLAGLKRNAQCLQENAQTGDSSDTSY